MKFKRFAVFFLSFSLLVTSVFASTKELKKKRDSKIDQKTKIEQKLKETKEKVKKKNAEASNVEKEIEKLDAEISKYDNSIFDLNQKMDVLNVEIAANEKKLDEANKNLDAVQDEFGERMRASYMNGRVGYLEVVMNSKSIEDLLNNIEMAKRIAESDKKMIDYVDFQITQIKEAKEKLVVAHQELDNSKRALEVQRGKLAIASENKSRYMNSLLKDVEKYKQEYEASEALWASLDKEIANLKKEIQSAEARESTSQRMNITTRAGASLGWPVPGHTRLSRGFGMMKHPILGYMKMHTGIDIPAPTGTPALSAAKGTVLMARTLGSYGNVVMVDHGSTVTVYAHLSVIKVRQGDRVDKGQVVGLVGSTGLSTGPHLHFEVRVNGTPQNPLNFV